jgi:hypothetical protein
MNLVKGSVEYFRSQAKLYDLQAGIAGVTNGVMGRDVLEWLAANFDESSVSFDGLGDVHLPAQFAGATRPSGFHPAGLSRDCSRPSNVCAKMRPLCHLAG